MSQPLFIWLPDDVAAPWHWANADRQGTAESQSKKNALGELGAHPINIVVSGQAVRMLPHDLPQMKDAERKIAAGFAVEGQIAAPLDQQHIVVAAGEDKRMAVISKDKMTAILGALSDAGIAPDGLYADHDVLPKGGAITLPDRIIYPGRQGHTLDRSWADAETADEPFSSLLPQINFDAAVNLLSGHFTKKSKLPINANGLIRIAALIGLGTIAWLVLQTAQTRAMTQHAAAIKAETAQMYARATGQVAPSNPALAVTRAVKSGNSNTADFLQLSSLLFRSLEQVDGIMIETLQFDAAKGQLSLRLIYPQFESASALETAVNQAGGFFQPGGVREQGGQLIGDAALKVAP